MNVLCDMEYPLDEKEMFGWGKAFSSIGYDFFFLNRKEKAIIDAFEEKKPSIFITHATLLNRASCKAIVKNEYCKAFVFIDSEEDKEKLKDKPNVFYISKNENLNCMFIEESCDLYLSLKPKTNINMICDICYIGDYVKECILSKCFSMFRVKCWGNTKWPFTTYLGKIKPDKIKDAICSSTTSLYLDDLNNKSWPLYTYLCNRPIVSYKSTWLKNVLKDKSLCFSDEESFFENLLNIIRNPEIAYENIKINSEFIKNNHLSHHRVSAILDAIGLKEDSVKCINVAMDLIKKY